MEKNDWGIKRVCLGCNTRFYDFNKSPIICPFCNTIFDPEHLSKKKTRASFEKSADIEAIKIDVDEEIISDEDVDIVNLDDSEEDLEIVDEA